MDWDLDCSNIGTLSGTSKLGFWAKPNRALVSHSYALCNHPGFFFSWILLNSWVFLRSNWRNNGKTFCLQRSVSSFLFCLVDSFYVFFWGWEGRIWQRWWGPTHLRRWWLSPMWRSMRQIHSLAGWLVARKARFGSFPSFLLLLAGFSYPFLFVLVSVQPISY